MTHKTGIDATNIEVDKKASKQFREANEKALRNAFGLSDKTTKKRKRSGGPTGASLDRAQTRITKAREATAEAEKHDEEQREARRLEAESYTAIGKKEKEVKDLKKDAAKHKSAALAAGAKAKKARAKAAKLAKG